MDYRKALEIQMSFHAKVSAGEIDDVLLLVEHPAVITLGVRGDYSNILVPLEELKKENIEIIKVKRGGDVTYHGPGQLVGYPIMNLANHGKSIKKYVPMLEKIFVNLLRDEYNIEAKPNEGKLTGVWVGDEKITAIGIAISRWITYHGFAFNVNTNLNHFKWIVPCGLQDKGVTSIQKLTGQEADFENVKDLVIKYFTQVFDVEIEKERYSTLGVNDGL